MVVEIRNEEHEFWYKGEPTGQYVRFEVLGELPLSGHVAVKSLSNGHVEYVNVSDVVIIES